MSFQVFRICRGKICHALSSRHKVPEKLYCKYLPQFHGNIFPLCPRYIPIRVILIRKHVTMSTLPLSGPLYSITTTITSSVDVTTVKRHAMSPKTMTLKAVRMTCQVQTLDTPVHNQWSSLVSSCVYTRITSHCKLSCFLKVGLEMYQRRRNVTSLFNWLIPAPSERLNH